MKIKALYFDFGFVIGYPRPGLKQRFSYLDWNGLPGLLSDPEISKRLQPGIGLRETEKYFQQELYEPFRIHENSDKIDPRSGVVLRSTLNQLVKGPINQALVDRVLDHINTMRYIHIYDTVPPILRSLAKRYTVSMISNMMLPGKLLMQKLRSHHIDTLFRTVSISSDVGYIKPHPRIFTTTLELDRLAPHQVLFIGDTFNQDILGAQGVGINTLWLNTRNERLPAKALAPDFTLDSLEKLPALLRTL